MIIEPPDYTERETPKLCRDEWNDSKKNTWSLGRLEIMTDFAMQTTEGRNDSVNIVLSKTMENRQKASGFLSG
jgi:hypothetical protein